MKNYWLDKIKHRVALEERWLPPVDDENGWYPIRPLDACASKVESTPSAEPNPYFVQMQQVVDGEKCKKRWKRVELHSSYGTSLIMKDDGQPAGEWSKCLEPFDFSLDVKAEPIIPDEITLVGHDIPDEVTVTVEQWDSDL